jgi:hypothetical protein
MDAINCIRDLFETDGFPARWNCGTGWSQSLGWLHILCDWAIFGAYAAIPIVLAVFLRRRRDIPFPATGWLFVAFILSCGVTHLVDSIMFYRPAYRFLGLMKFLTVVASWATVISLFRIMPAVLRVPAIQRQNQTLRSDLDDREREARSLERVRDQLESRSAEVTRQVTHLVGAFEAAGVFAAEWEVESDRLHWQMGTERLLGRSGISVLSEWTQLLGSEGARALHDASRAIVAAEQVLDITVPVVIGEPGRSMRLVARLGATAAGPPMLMGMARLIGPEAGRAGADA